MRTTLAIEDNVLEEARTLATRLHTPFRRVINEALRAGLQKIAEPAGRRPYRTRPHKMGVRDGMCLDNIQELLSQVGGENVR